ncbi:MAG TPA: hypothetical protein VKR43_21995 [Bryobacteraceae bacterium]|nr:hypothetical protein [Bryobacteraceae bacterium]
MPDSDAPISLDLTKSKSEQLPAVEDLQFRRAQPIAGATQPAQACVVCKQTIEDQYFHAQGQVVCPVCAGRIQSGQQSPPSLSLVRAVLYGAGAALAGCILYATVSIVTGLEIGLIAIVVGIMVGKAIRYASHGLGGRPQQILAVLLTYFAITTSYVPVFVYHARKSPKPAVQTSEAAGTAQPGAAQNARPARPISRGTAILYVMGLVAAAPFLGLFAGSNPIGALISLFIIYIGLQRAWALTARSQILIMGPYKTSGA